FVFPGCFCALRRRRAGAVEIVRAPSPLPSDRRSRGLVLGCCLYGHKCGGADSRTANTANEISTGQGDGHGHVAILSRMFAAELRLVAMARAARFSRLDVGRRGGSLLFSCLVGGLEVVDGAEKVAGEERFGNAFP